jgi:hypothetical protein
MSEFHRIPTFLFDGMVLLLAALPAFRKLSLFPFLLFEE